MSQHSTQTANPTRRGPPQPTAPAAPTILAPTRRKYARPTHELRAPSTATTGKPVYRTDETSPCGGSS